mmetsp:Transcript_27138/g.63436  ORF Transcript_27138/g.63436 Transcript_27138/m.63436 type:complete len:101 (+) Transcript_27138:2-304(+)
MDNHIGVMVTNLDNFTDVFAANDVAYFTRCNGGAKCFASDEVPSVPLPDAARVRDDTDDPNGAIWADAFVILPGGTTFEIMGPSTLESFVQWDLCGPYVA